MPHFYLLHPDQTYSDFAEYPDLPAAREEGVWVEGSPTGLAPFKALTLADQLAARFDTSDLDVQAHFAPLRAAIKLELEQGRTAVAKRIIELATIPPELEAERQQLLACFP